MHTGPVTTVHEEITMTGSAAGGRAEDGAPDGPPGLPRWVKVLAVGALVVVVMLVVAMVLLGGEHGPGMHGG